MYFRLTQDVKKQFVVFFRTLFTLYGENKITFVDGRSKIVFAAQPQCEELDTYNTKHYPIVLVSASPGSCKEASFNKVRGVDRDTNETLYGWMANFTINFLIVSLTKEDRDQLVDIICVYLSKAETKQAFEQKGLRIQMPIFSGDSSEEDPQTNVRRFFTSVSITVEGDIEDTLTIVDSQGRAGLTVQDVLSYIGDVDGDGEIANLKG